MIRELQNVFLLRRVKIENNIETATVIMTVNCYDYIVDSQNKVVRGNDKNKIEIPFPQTDVHIKQAK